MLLFLLRRLQRSGCPCAGSGRCTAACGGGGLQPGLVPLPQERLVIDLVPIVLARNGGSLGSKIKERWTVSTSDIFYTVITREVHISL